MSEFVFTKARMRLADFILSHLEPILAEWEIFARSIEAGAEMEVVGLRDHAEAILRATAEDMKQTQSSAQQSDKSKGLRRRELSGLYLSGVSELNSASDLHATERLGSGFNLMEVIAEYRALRASVLRLWTESTPTPDEHDLRDLTRFNESIDQSLGRAIGSYTRRVDQSRDLFLAILGHDLRNPLNSIAVTAEMLNPPLAPSPTPALPFPGTPHSRTPATSTTPASSAASAALPFSVRDGAAQITTDTKVMARMISDLLDYTRTRLGAGMPVRPADMDLDALGRELFQQFRSAHPARDFRYKSEGDLHGDWDADRLRQAVSNLLGNAFQHSAKTATITLDLSSPPDSPTPVAGDHVDDVFLVVHNDGPPIPPGELPKIFDPLIRGSSAAKPKANRPGSIGLGLYIAREVARSHHGRIDVTSTEAAGTTFTVRLPRHPPFIPLPTGTPSPRPATPILDEAHLKTM